MNDISVKIEEATRELEKCVESTTPTEPAAQENEVDPLALGEDEVKKEKDPLIIKPSEKVLPQSNLGDRDAKEILSKDESPLKSLCFQAIKVAENLLKAERNLSKSAPETLTTADKVIDEPESLCKVVKVKNEELPVESTAPPEPVKPIEVPNKPENEVSIKAPSAQSLDTSTVAVENKVQAVAPVEEISDIVVKVKDLKEVEEMEVDTTEVKDNKTEKKTTEAKIEVKPVNGDCPVTNTIKRRASEDVETESPLKKLCQEIERTFPNHDTMIKDYIQNSSKGNIDEIQRHTEQLLSEIQTLRELAQKKEHEWNNILHLKKVKEEILLRLLRQKQVFSFEKSIEVNGIDRPEAFDFLNQPKNYAIDKSDDISGLSIKPPMPTNNPPMQVPMMPSHYNPMAIHPPPYDKAAHLHNLQKNLYPGPMMLPGPTMTGFPRDPRDMNGQLTSNFGLPMGRQGPTKDVKSIIADYRQRNPDNTPRRGRRMKSILNPNMMNPPRPIAPKLDNMNNLSNLGMMFNNLDMNQKAMLERLSQMQTTTLPNGLSFKDVLVQFANMQQQPNPGLLIRPEMMPSRPPDHHQMRQNEMRNINRRPEKPSMTHPDSEVHISMKQSDRHASASPRLPPPPPYPEISLLPVTSSSQEHLRTNSPQNSLLHGILTKQGSPATQSYSPTLAKLLTSPERKQSTPTLPSFGQAKSCGEITITPVQPTPSPSNPEPAADKGEDVVQLDDEESALSDGDASAEGDERRLVIDEGSTGAEETPLCQGCRRKDAQFVCAGCANQWYCSRECQVAAWDDHSEMCSG